MDTGGWEITINILTEGEILCTTHCNSNHDKAHITFKVSLYIRLRQIKPNPDDIYKEKYRHLTKIVTMVAVEGIESITLHCVSVVYLELLLLRPSSRHDFSRVELRPRPQNLVLVSPTSTTILV